MDKALMLLALGAAAYVAPSAFLHTQDISVLNQSRFESVNYSRTSLTAHPMTVSKSVEVRKSDSMPWLEQFYKTGINADSAKDVYPLVDGIRGLFAADKLKDVDSMLGELDVSKLSCTALVTILATVFPAKTDLNEWDFAVHVIGSKLASAGFDPSEVLYGLV